MKAMRVSLSLCLLVGLLFLPVAARAAADTNPFDRALTVKGPAWIEPGTLVLPDVKKQEPLVGTALWLPMREVRTALATPPPVLEPLTADGFRFVKQRGTSVVLRGIPLSLNLSWTPFPPSRVRSRFEPLYPRFW
jgi:hypothetical protein